jgi:hypothetical protein
MTAYKFIEIEENDFIIIKIYLDFIDKKKMEESKKDKKFKDFVIQTGISVYNLLLPNLIYISGENNFILFFSERNLPIFGGKRDIHLSKLVSYLTLKFNKYFSTFDALFVKATMHLYDNKIRSINDFCKFIKIHQFIIITNLLKEQNLLKFDSNYKNKILIEEIFYKGCFIKNNINKERIVLSSTDFFDLNNLHDINPYELNSIENLISEYKIDKDLFNIIYKKKFEPIRYDLI